MSGLHSPNLDEELNSRRIVATSLDLNPGFDAPPFLAASKNDDLGGQSSENGAIPMPYRILHVGDDPDVREIVALSLNAEPTFLVQSCAGGDDAIKAAAGWAPDLILCDTMMPEMGGPAMLSRLRENPKTAHIAVVFIAARPQPREIDHLMSLGAAGVITNPFEPATLVDTIRKHFHGIKLRTTRDDFSRRLRADAVILAKRQKVTGGDSLSPSALEELQSCAHKLAGAAGIFGFQTVSCAAFKLEGSIENRRRGDGTTGELESELDMLLGSIGQALQATNRIESRSAIVDVPDTDQVTPTLSTADELEFELDSPIIGKIDPHNKAPKILIADDDREIVKFLADQCTKMGFRVQTAPNGLQALIMASRNPPDVLITDVNMPELDGLSVCMRLLGPDRKGTEVVVITGGSNAAVAERCESFGAYHVRKGPQLWDQVKSALTDIFPELTSGAVEVVMPPSSQEMRERPLVLLVDDDPEAAIFLSSRLRKYGVDMLCATDGAQGYLMARREKPNVIISDYFMPNGDVIYLLWRLRGTAATESIPVFVLSGRHLDETTIGTVKREILGRPGAVGVFKKSFDTQELFTAIQKVCSFEYFQARA
jgi:CheY-like chemotaxis protein